MNRVWLAIAVAGAGGLALVVPASQAAGAQPRGPATPATAPAPCSAVGDTATRAIERAKLVEQQRATKLTMATILVTAALGFGTIAYNLRNTSRQAQLQAKLKALDVVISASGPNAARERLATVAKLLGPDLRLDTQPSDLDIAGVGAGHDQNRKDLIRMLAENPQRQLEILALWDVLFGKTALGPSIEALKGHVGRSISSTPAPPAA
jgi:hypothetical protein